ncbi:MAG: flagellar hook-length control protein FliK, partial [Pseudomonadales bacterium]
LIEARVIDVLTRATAQGSADAGQASQAGAARAGRNPIAAAVQTSAQPGNREAATDAAGATNAARSAAPSSVQTAASTGTAAYEVILAVGTQRLTLLAALAPRTGQYLQLSVSNSQQVQVVAATTLPADAAQAAAARAARPGNAGAAQSAINTPAAANRPIGSSASAGYFAAPSAALPGDATSELINQALRDVLPRQSPRDALAQNLLELLRAAGTNAPPGTTSNNTVATVSQKPATGQLSITAPATSAARNVAAPTTLNTAVASTSANMPNANTGVVPSGAPNAATTALPAAVQQAAAQLLASIPGQRELVEAAGVKRAVLDSGLFYEHKLALAATALRTRNANAPAAAPREQSGLLASGQQIDALARREVDAATRQDYKHALLQLLAALRNAAGLRSTAPLLNAGSEELALLAGADSIRGAESGTVQSGAARSGETDAILQLLRLVLGASARVQTQQLLSASNQLASQADPATNQSLNIGIPLWMDQRLSILDLHIQRERSKTKARTQDTTWNLRLRFDLEELGELTALATLHGQRVAAALWASTSELASAVQGELEEVGDTLARFGLQVQNLQCCTGEPPPGGESGAVNLLQTPLLDTRG